MDSQTKFKADKENDKDKMLNAPLGGVIFSERQNFHIDTSCLFSTISVMLKNRSYNKTLLTELIH